MMIWIVGIVVALIGVCVKINLYSLRGFLKFSLYQWINQSSIQKEITKFEYITIPVFDYELFLLIMNL